MPRHCSVCRTGSKLPAAPVGRSPKSKIWRNPGHPAVAAVLFVAGLWHASAAVAHEFSITDVLVVFKSNGVYQIDVTVDVDALALGVSSTADSAELASRLRSMPTDEFETCVARARRTMIRRTRVRFDDTKQDPEVTFPEYGTPLVERSAEPTVLGITARLTGVVPEDAASFTFGASRAFGPVHLTILDQATATGFKQVLSPSENSSPYRFGEPAPPVNRREVAGRYLVLGFEHILPKGLDHILFVLGLFLLSTKLRPLLWQVTAFTLAHSVTLAMSTYGVFSLPSSVVEPLIALSIAYVAVENIVTSELKPWRPFVVFAFGLLHGLGFAGVLKELGLPRGEFLTALVTFNVGVEFGQLCVVLLAFATIGLFRNSRHYRRWAVIPASTLIALVGVYWAVTRALPGIF